MNDSNSSMQDLVNIASTVIERDKTKHEEVKKRKLFAFNFKELEWRTQYKDPQRFSIENKRDVYSLFNEISHQDNVSDILISPYLPVLIKVKRGGLFAITKRSLDIRETEAMVQIITNNPNAISLVREKESVSGLALLLESDIIDTHYAEDIVEFEYQLKTRYRYEITGSSGIESEGAFQMVLRPLPVEPTKFDKLKIPESFVKTCLVKDGIVVIGGATGEGKTTTLAAIIRYILENDTIIKGNIITHEEPIEISYASIRSKHSWVTQSAIGYHVDSFANANRAAMRRSPDLVLLGELRDGATVEAAVELSLTGHPVFATTHANCVAAIFPRLLSRFPKEQQSEKCFDLVDTVRVLASQKLIWRTDGKLMAVREHLEFTPELRQYLSKYTNNPSTVIRKIQGIMDKGLFGVESYKVQGLRLLKNGEIPESSYRHLVDNTTGLDADTLQALENL